MKSRNERAKEQLGIHLSTAQGKLVKDILWKLIQETNNNKCFVCGEEMTREDFSIEHKTAWLDKENAKELFWDLNNISFSHLTCNISRKNRKKQTKHGTITMYNKHKCRCDLCIAINREKQKKYYTKEKRQERYKRTGY